MWSFLFDSASINCTNAWVDDVGKLAGHFADNSHIIYHLIPCIVAFLLPEPQAAVWNIPWAISVAYDKASFEEVLATSRSMFFRYTPDSQFGLVSPVEVIFPAHNSAAWASGNFSTASTDVSVQKLLSQDLITLAPEVDAFIVAFDLTAAHVETLLADSEALGSFRSGACNWLNNWPEVAWLSWDLIVYCHTFFILLPHLHNVVCECSLPHWSESNTFPVAEHFLWFIVYGSQVSTIFHNYITISRCCIKRISSVYRFHTSVFFEVSRPSRREFGPVNNPTERQAWNWHGPRFGSRGSRVSPAPPLAPPALRPQI